MRSGCQTALARPATIARSSPPSATTRLRFFFHWLRRALSLALLMGLAATHAAARLPAPAEAAALDYFCVKSGEKTHQLRWAEVAALKAGKNYVTLRLAAYNTGYPLRGSLADVLDQLLPEALRPHFLRVNRRTSLNVAHITAYDDAFVYCGAERYEKGGTAQQQLPALKL